MGESTCTSPLMRALMLAFSSGRNRTITFSVLALCSVPQYLGFALSTILSFGSKETTVYGPEPNAPFF